MDVVDQTGEGQRLAGAVVVVDAVLHARAAGARGVQAGDQLEAVGEAELAGAVDRAALVDAVAEGGDALIEVGHREAAVQHLLQRQRLAQVVVARRHVDLVAAGRGAEHGLVLAAGQLERPLELQVGEGLALLVVVGRGPAEQAGAGRAVGRAVDVEHGRVRADAALVERGLGAPAAAQVVQQLGEAAAVVGVPARPGGRGAGRAVVVDGRAVAVVQRQRAPHQALGPVVLLGVAQGQHGGRAQVGLDHPRGHLLAGLVAVEVGVLVLVGHDQAAAQAATGVQRAGHIGVDPAQVPGAQGQAGAGLQLRGRALAHEVDRGRGVAGGREQAVGAAQHLHAVVDRGVHVAVEQARGEGQADAVLLEVGDVEAAGGKVGAVGLDLLDLHAGHPGQQGAHLVEAEGLHLGLRGHAHGLGRLAQAQVQAGGRAGHRRAEGWRLFGRCGAGAVAHDHRAQRGLRRGGCRLGQGGRGQSEQDRTGEGDAGSEGERAERCRGRQVGVHGSRDSSSVVRRGSLAGS